jgi:hypothetical protein
VVASRAPRRRTATSPPPAPPQPVHQLQLT